MTCSGHPSPRVHPSALISAAARADTEVMQIMYVETCPDCDCALVRAKSGEPRPSRMLAGCAGCSCHTAWQLASGA
jgi:hypothetical protein